MKKEKSVLHLCECTLLALVILLIIDLYLLKFLQEPGVSYYLLCSGLWKLHWLCLW